MTAMGKMSRLGVSALIVALALGLAVGVAIGSQAQSASGVEGLTPDGNAEEIGIASITSGRVELQGRSDWSGAVVTIWPVGVTDTTDVDGFYTLPALPVGAYTLTVEMSRYLDGERMITLVWGANSVPTVRLVAGDVNDDDEVDIVDMSIIGGKYDSAVDPLTERADVNMDGYVDIVDIVLTAGNYGSKSPVPWP